MVADEIYRDILFTKTGDSGFAYKFIRRMKLHTVVHDYSSAINVEECCFVRVLEIGSVRRISPADALKACFPSSAKWCEAFLWQRA